MYMYMTANKPETAVQGCAFLSLGSHTFCYHVYSLHCVDRYKLYIHVYIYTCIYMYYVCRHDMCECARTLRKGALVCTQ